ncbi:MAG TPA: hypothetical protein DCZ01_12490 [Elusimicrobia bacterium]|nr:MAG: hypothetical protein A2X37_05695 [Elusimicrobia bacterium GWA2_66_18]OGR68799.1 MAG: hypothetical protein A2X40_08985 [Elusimicrobia bacterium GWC2_65_9]HAZ09305.1 hypothetical protein [Elusimicrobiota bacterium]
MFPDKMRALALAQGIFLLASTEGCTGLRRVKTNLTPGLDISNYVRVAVLPASASSAEARLADEFSHELTEMGKLVTQRPALTAQLGSLPKTWNTERVKELAATAQLDLVGFTTLEYRHGVAVVTLSLLDARTGRPVIIITLEHESGLLGGSLPYHDIASMMIEDVKKNIVSPDSRTRKLNW